MSVKPAIKTLWLIILAAFLIGVGLTGLGLAMGAARSAIYFDRSGLHIDGANASSGEVSNLNSESFEDISIALASAEVEFKASQDGSYGYGVRTNDASQIIANVENGRLSIKQDATWFRWNLFNWYSPSDKVTVYIPLDAVLNNVRVSTASGDVHVVDSLSCATFTLEVASGNFSSTNSTLRAQTLNLRLASGDVELASVETSEAVLSAMSGSFNFGDFIARDLKIETASGDIKIDNGSIEKNISISMASGNARINLTGSAEDFEKTVNTMSGEVFFDDTLVGNGYRDNSGAPGKISISSASGDVRFTFGGQQ